MKKISMKVWIGKAGVKYGRVASVSFLVGVVALSGAHMYALAQTAVYPAGHLHQDSGSGSSSDFTCDSGYSLSSYHYEAGSTNNADWYACSLSSHVPPACSMVGTGDGAGDIDFQWTSTNTASLYISATNGSGTTGYQAANGSGEIDGKPGTPITISINVTAPNGNTASCSETFANPKQVGGNK